MIFVETVVHQISRRFDWVRDELHAGHRSILQGTLEHLESMHEERFFFELVFALNHSFNNLSIFLAPLISLIWYNLRKNMP